MIELKQAAAIAAEFLAAFAVAFVVAAFVAWDADLSAWSVYGRAVLAFVSVALFAAMQIRRIK